MFIFLGIETVDHGLMSFNVSGIDTIRDDKTYEGEGRCYIVMRSGIQYHCAESREQVVQALNAIFTASAIHIPR